MNAIDCFLQECHNKACEFEKNTRQTDLNSEEADDAEDEEKEDTEEFEPVVLPQDDCHSRTTMFF